jgi:glycerophosphoryl diester phosphodiesterase
MVHPRFDRPIAHRGLHDRSRGVIENSASAFEAAIKAGFHIECDLQLTRDGVPVVFHDDDLERLTGRKGRINELTAEEATSLPLLGSAAGDTPQRFTDLLKQVGGRTLLQVELKHQRPSNNRTLARRAVEAVANYKGPLVFESFDPDLVALVRTFGFRGARGIITYRYDRPDWDKDLTWAQKFYLRNLLHWPRSRFDFLSVHEDSLDVPAVRFWRKRGKPVTSWTIRSRDAGRKALGGGADQIVFEGFDPGG